MAAHRTRNTKKKETPTSSMSLPLIMVCSILVSACIGFGNPSLWATNAQAASAYSEPTPDTVQSGTFSPFGSVDDNTSRMEKIGEYTAVSQSDSAERATNIALAADSINKVELNPGEEMSFNELVGDTANDEKYEIAPIIYGSGTDFGRGGGICQVSTALYIAALYSDLEIVERHPHSVAVDYALIGLDATVLYDTMDLRIKNTSDYPIRIEATAEGQTVTVKILGEPSNDNTTIDVLSKVLEEKEATDVEVSSGQTAYYYTVESYRVYKVDGVATDTQTLGVDEYVVYKPAANSVTEGSYDPTK